MGPIANARSWRDAGAAAVNGVAAIIVFEIVADLLYRRLSDGLLYLLPAHGRSDLLLVALLIFGIVTLLARFFGSLGLGILWVLGFAAWSTEVVGELMWSGWNAMQAAPFLISPFVSWGVLAFGIGLSTDLLIPRPFPTRWRLSQSMRWVLPLLVIWLPVAWLNGFAVDVGGGPVWEVSTRWGLVAVMIPVPFVLSGWFLGRTFVAWRGSREAVQ